MKRFRRLTDMAKTIYYRGYQMRPEVAQHHQRCEALGLCVACGEPIGDDERQTRGCHETCYQRVYHHSIKPIPRTKPQARRRQFRKLVLEGLLGVRDSPGPKPQINPVTQRLAAAIQSGALN